MYQFPNQQLYHHNHYQPCPISSEDMKLQNLNTISEAHYHVLPHLGDHTARLQAPRVIEEPPVQPEANGSVKKKKSTTKKPKPRPAKSNDSIKKTVKKHAVDTSTFSIEERLVAAVWVHERKTTDTTISEIKHNFRRRFSREPPSKTTLFAWERKLFASGNVCDAPRTGRPVNRKSHISAVAASVRAAPALSLRARALALRLPRTTLHSILRNDLPHMQHTPHTRKQRGLVQVADKLPGKHRVKQPAPAHRSQASAPAAAHHAPPAPAAAHHAPPAPAAAHHAPPHMHYVMHTHAHPYT